MNSNWSNSPETPNLGQIRRFLELCDLEIWSLIKISKISSDSPENFLLCNHCENIMPLLQTIIEIQHFPCLKIVKFCTLSNRSMKFPTSGKNYVDNKTIYCGTPQKKNDKNANNLPKF